MVSRKPLPKSYSPTGGGTGSDGVPDILRPGGGRNRPQPPSSNMPSQDAPNAYSNFESEEQSVWRQQGHPPQSQQRPIPTILLQTATGSSSASALSDTNPFKRKAMNNNIHAASPTSMSSSTSPSELSQPQPHPQLQSQNQSQPPTSSFAQLGMGDQPAQNPWQPGSFDNSRANSASPSPLPTIVDDGEAEGAAGASAWAAQAHAMASGGPPPVTRPPIPVGLGAGAGAGAGAASFRNSNLISFPPDEEADSADWSDVASPSAASSTVVSAAPPSRPPFIPLDGKEAEPSVYADSHAWDDVGGKMPSQPQAVPLVTEATGEGWNLVDAEPVPGQLSRRSTWEAFSDDEDEDKDARKQAAKPGSSAQNTSAQNTSAQRGSFSQTQQLVAANATSSKAKGKKAVDEPLIDIDSLPSGSQPSRQNQPSAQSDDNVSSAPMSTPTSSRRQDTSPANDDFRPQLPPRSMLDIDSAPPPAQPPRPVDSSKTETYQVKLINWYDARAVANPRTSPILVQNANGPCPLVALVNALTLTTPADTKTALVEALRTREQVSLDLLLGNVFDELMSRRSGNEISLPDIDELYSFLKGLHTGMNVNPRYIPTPEVATAFRRTSLTHLHPTERKEMIPGTFEDTREMQLYATFSIPLIHGWLPAKGEPAYDALSRRATSYEDVQNLLFREEELEEKLSSPHNEDGLSFEEQGLYQDILEIKTFLHVSATQLTAFGLDVLSKAMVPGSFAILFRNDHFATLYLHPGTMQLMSLVTDAGYATHDEVVWETLVDVNGEHTAYFSGDFRLVGENAGGAAVASSRGSGSGSRSGHGHSESHNGSSSTDAAAAGMADDEQLRHEQEDRDLALALQLQEEEEAQQREDEARRQSRLSEQYIEQNGRRSSGATSAAGAAAAQNRLPRNASGGGRYSSASAQSSQQPPVLPRRSSAGATLTGAAATGRRPTPQQVVRPLVPPATTTTATSNTSVGATRIVNGRPAVHRAQGGDDDTEAPPSYEHAAMLAPYHPPPGAPGSETATLCGTTSNTSTNTNGNNRRPSPAGSAVSQQQQQGGQPPRTGMGYATQSGQPFAAPGRYGQLPSVADNRSDRECILM